MYCANPARYSKMPYNRLGRSGLKLPAISLGLCAAIYTQVSDVEDETNGLLSYDRAVLKVDEAEMKTLAERLLGQL